MAAVGETAIMSHGDVVSIREATASMIGDCGHAWTSAAMVTLSTVRRSLRHRPRIHRHQVLTTPHCPHCGAGATLITV